MLTLLGVTVMQLKLHHSPPSNLPTSIATFTLPQITRDPTLTCTAQLTATAPVIASPVATLPVATLDSNLGEPLDLYFNCLPPPYAQRADQFDGVSDSGVAMVAGFEGFVSQKYNDGVALTDALFYDISGNSQGNCTIGYGYLLHLGPCNGSEGEGYSGGISQQAAAKLLKNQLDHCATYVAQYVNVPITQDQYDVLAGLICNWGYGKFSQSEVLNKLNARQYTAAGTALKSTALSGIGGSWPYPGLIKRRSVESERFLSRVAAPYCDYVWH